MSLLPPNSASSGGGADPAEGLDSVEIVSVSLAPSILDKSPHAATDCLHPHGCALCYCAVCDEPLVDCADPTMHPAAAAEKARLIRAGDGQRGALDEKAEGSAESMACAGSNSDGGVDALVVDIHAISLGNARKSDAGAASAASVAEILAENRALRARIAELEKEVTRLAGTGCSHTAM
jgi:hypothetical protein